MKLWGNFAHRVLIKEQSEKKGSETGLSSCDEHVQEEKTSGADDNEQEKGGDKGGNSTKSQEPPVGEAFTKMVQEVLKEIAQSVSLGERDAEPHCNDACRHADQSEGTAELAAT